MKKTTIVITAVILVILVGAAIIFLPKLTSGSNLNIANAEDLSKLVEDIYAGVTLEMPGVMTQAIDVADKDMVSYVTGLENGDELEYAVVSEPMMSSQAYSMVIAKVKSGVNASKVAETMKDNIDTRKWICVSAEQLYATNSGDVVFLVMTNKELADAVYTSFKTLAGGIGQEFEKIEQEVELPADMY